MSLDFVYFFHFQCSTMRLVFSNFQYLNGTWSIWVSYTSKERSCIMSHCKLWNVDPCIIWFFLLVCVPNLAIVTDTICLKFSSRNVDYTSHYNILLVEILLNNSLRTFFCINKIPEVNSSTLTAWYKTHIMMNPVNWSYFLNMSFALEIWWILSCIKVVDESWIISMSCCKQMATMTESNLPTCFDRNISIIV